MKKHPLKWNIFLFIFFISFSSFALDATALGKTTKKKHNTTAKSYKYQLTACLLFQNEDRHLREWLEYHKLIGVEHFYLFNNLSTDNYLAVLEPYLSSGEVELYDYPFTSTNQAEYLGIQCAAYNQALTIASKEAKWLALIDTDEFIVPLKTDSLLEALKEFENYGGVYLNWLVFGTSHVEKVPEDRLKIEMLNHCEKTPVALGKSIVRPERVKIACNDPHRMWYLPPYFHVNTNHKFFDWVAPIADKKLIIHHYYPGDLDFLVNVKFPRVRKWIGIELNSYIESVEHFNARENNTMQRFIPKLKARMNLQ